MDNNIEEKDNNIEDKDSKDIEHKESNDIEVKEDSDIEKKNSKIKKKRIGVIISIVALVSILISITTGYFYVRSKIYTKNKPVSSTKIENNQNLEEEIKYKEVEGITNVLLIGSDGRSDDDTPKSDSIIIATMDNNNNKVKLTSLYRDTLVKIPGHGENRINAAFELGGVDLLLKTIKETYDINIEKYVVINFAGFESVIDHIGGIEVDVKDYQLEELNKYIGEGTTGNDSPVKETGVQILNGKQILSYSRIRKNVGDDYERTERQREVLFKVAQKLKDTKPTKYLAMMNSVLNYIDMNIEPIEALDMAYTIYKFPSLDTEQISIPLQELIVEKELPVIGDVLLMDKYENTKIMHEFIFEDKSEVANKLED